MALHKISDFDPNYREHFGDNDLKGLDLYSKDEKVGTVDDVLVDDEGRIRYFVINTGLWIFGKKVLLPIGQARVDYNAHCIHADNLTKAHVEALPQLTDDMTVDYDHEDRVRSIYRSSTSGAPTAAGVGYAGAASAPTTANAAPPLDFSEGGHNGYDRPNYSYHSDPDLYEINDEVHQKLKLYQEKLIAKRNR